MKELSLREIQLAELNILIEFDEFCRSNNLTYSLIGGTLLGAVRHGGFIPWDDDIDIGMPRPDYEKFYELLTQKDGKLSEKYFMVSDRGGGALNPYLKLVDKDVFIESAIGEATENIWIDVMPVDGYPVNDKQAEKYWRKIRKYRRIILYNYSNGKKYRGLKRIGIAMFIAYAKLYGSKRAIEKIKKLIDKYPYEKSELIGIAVWGMYGIKERIGSDSFKSIVEVTFEGLKFPAFHNWDEYLKGIYGNYMELPPENKRHTHSFKAYKKI